MHECFFIILKACESMCTCRCICVVCVCLIDRIKIYFIGFACLKHESEWVSSESSWFLYSRAFGWIEQAAPTATCYHQAHYRLYGWTISYTGDKFIFPIPDLHYFFPTPNTEAQIYKFQKPAICPLVENLRHEPNYFSSLQVWRSNWAHSCLLSWNMGQHQ